MSLIGKEYIFICIARCTRVYSKATGLFLLYMKAGWARSGDRPQQLDGFLSL